MRGEARLDVEMTSQAAPAKAQDVPRHESELPSKSTRPKSHSDVSDTVRFVFYQTYPNGERSRRGHVISRLQLIFFFTLQKLLLHASPMAFPKRARTDRRRKPKLLTALELSGPAAAPSSPSAAQSKIANRLVPSESSRQVTEDIGRTRAQPIQPSMGMEKVVRGHYWIFEYRIATQVALYVMRCPSPSCQSPVFSRHPLKRGRAAVHLKACGQYFKNEEDMVRRYAQLGLTHYAYLRVHREANRVSHSHASPPEQAPNNVRRSKAQRDPLVKGRTGSRDREPRRRDPIAASE